MGIRGEIYSTKLILQNRSYFFNVKENRMGDLYLNIVESKNKDSGGFERQSVIVFADDLPGFLGDFDKALKVLEKSVREQKKSGERGERKEEKSGRSSGDSRPAKRVVIKKGGSHEKASHHTGDRPVGSRRLQNH